MQHELEHAILAFTPRQIGPHLLGCKRESALLGPPALVVLEGDFSTYTASSMTATRKPRFSAW
jgi:hypothetical protein